MSLHTRKRLPSTKSSFRFQLLRCDRRDQVSIQHSWDANEIVYEQCHRLFTKKIRIRNVVPLFRSKKVLNELIYEFLYVLPFCST